MEDIMKVKDLIEELQARDPELPVMIAVIKYPEEFAIRIKEGEASWTTSTDIECVPLGHGEVTNQNGIIMIAVELEDYSLQRHHAGG